MKRCIICRRRIWPFQLSVAQRYMHQRCSDLAIRQWNAHIADAYARKQQEQKGGRP